MLPFLNFLHLISMGVPGIWENRIIFFPNLYHISCFHIKLKKQKQNTNQPTDQPNKQTNKSALLDAILAP